MPSHFFALQPIPDKCHSLTGHTRATTAQEPQEPPLFHIAFQITHSTENECRIQSKPIVPPGKPHFPPSLPGLFLIASLTYNSITFAHLHPAS